jgi:hypothetical protein
VGAAGGDLTTSPLLDGVEPPAPELVDIVVDRFLAQRRSWSLAIVSASRDNSPRASMSVG